MSPRFSVQRDSARRPFLRRWVVFSSGAIAAIIGSICVVVLVREQSVKAEFTALMADDVDDDERNYEVTAQLIARHPAKVARLLLNHVDHESKRTDEESLTYFIKQFNDRGDQVYHHDDNDCVLVICAVNGGMIDFVANIVAFASSHLSIMRYLASRKRLEESRLMTLLSSASRKLSAAGPAGRSGSSSRGR